MKGQQLKAFFVTLLLFSTIAWFFMGRPGIDSLNILEPLKRVFSKSGDNQEVGKRYVATEKVGTKIDSYKGVGVYFNGHVTNVEGRNKTIDGYNLGLKYQCVEFAKRFFYKAYGHKMPDSYGHARDFFNPNIADGGFNEKRGMLQYRNGGFTKPKADDLAIIGPMSNNEFGHLFVLTKVTNTSVEFIQQNPGLGNPSRGKYKLENRDGTWYIDAKGLVGWLRMR